MHCAILNDDTDEAIKLFEYLLKHTPNCIETKTAQGHTPLALAFSRHNTRAAKILIEAGADQTVRDRKGNNLIHLLLVELHGYPMVRDWDIGGTIDSTKELLSLIDQRLVPSLLTQRSSDIPGSVTPIARWVYRKFYRSNGSKVAESPASVCLMGIMLEFAESTGQKHLELLDGTGNTPVHDAVSYILPQILTMMLDRRPDLLNRENAVGWTPAEVAMHRYEEVATSEIPPIPDLPRYNTQWDDPPSAWPRNLFLDREPESFVSAEEEDSEHPKRDIYNLCLRKAAEGAGQKRRLVSLFEANEVAKRLAARNNRNYHGSDIISKWY